MTELAPNSQEIERVPRGSTLAVVLGTLVLSALLSAAAAWLLAARLDTLHSAKGPATSVRPEPVVGGVQMKLSTQPGAAQALQAQQRARLRGYAWVDRARGIVRIPIDVEMDLEAEGRP